MAKKSGQKSQVLDLLLHVAELLGAENDRDVAALCGVSADNVDNWRSGASQEIKGQTLETAKARLAARVALLRERARALDDTHDSGLVALEIEEASGPASLQRQFYDRVTYDYLGHRFLYFEPQGALAWENLMKGGYDQNCWLNGVAHCAQQFFDASGKGGAPIGPLARALNLGKKGTPRGLDVVSLGPGEASKEAILAQSILDTGEPLPWLALALVDVSVPLLIKGAKACRKMLANSEAAVLPFVADFEEGALGFMNRLPTSALERSDGVRMVLMLGNVFGNVRDEEELLGDRLARLTRPGDFLWLEVAHRLERVEDDPVYRMTQPRPDAEMTAPEANRRLLLEGPYRRWEAATGRRPSPMHMRVWLRENDDTSRVPGSINFCHDLVFTEERRACTMLYSRRYDIAQLGKWLDARGWAVEAVVPVDDSHKRTRVAHLLARRR